MSDRRWSRKDTRAGRSPHRRALVAPIVVSLLCACGQSPEPPTDAQVATAAATASTTSVTAPLPEVVPTLSAEEEARVRRLLTELAETANWDRRLELTEQLKQVGRGATPLILEQVTREDQQLCSHLVDVLGELKDPRAVPRLLEVVAWVWSPDLPSFDLGDSKDDRRHLVFCAQEASDALGQIRDLRTLEPLLAAAAKDKTGRVLRSLWYFGDAAVAPARAGLRSPDAERRQSAVRFLSESERLVSPEEIQHLLQDPETEVRRESVTALVRLTKMNTVPWLLPMLKDPDAEIRFSAATAAFRQGDRRVIDVLVADLITRLNGKRPNASGKDVPIPEDEFHHHQYEWVKLAGEVADKRLTDAVLKTLKHFDISTRELSAAGLGRIGGDAAVVGLIDGLVDWQSGKACAEALDALGWRARTSEEHTRYRVAKRDRAGIRANWLTAKPVLLSDTTSNDPRYVESAVFTLIELGQSDLVPELIRLLKSKGTISIAQAYLNAGNPALEAAAREWATQRRLIITSSVGGVDARWPGS